jgi:hypothetical protein
MHAPDQLLGISNMPRLGIEHCTFDGQFEAWLHRRCFVGRQLHEVNAMAPSLFEPGFSRFCASLARPDG